MDLHGHLNQYQGKIASLHSPLTKECDLPQSFLMESQGRYEIYYTPLDFVICSAQIVPVCARMLHSGVLMS